MKTSVIEKIKTAPKNPGVYIFYRGPAPLYVGKASNLKNRLKSYLKVTDLKTQSLHQEATRLSYTILRSEIESLIEESRFIKELKPKYNILWRDDKSYLYVAFTRSTSSGQAKENFPKLFITHKNLKARYSKLKTELVGPFTDGNALRLAMKVIRRYFPYCTCFQSHLRDCLNAQIGKCLGICCQRNTNPQMHANTTNEYKKNIQSIKAILRGQSKKFLKSLSDQKERKALEKIFEHQPYILRDVPANQLLPLQNINRVECYDISNCAGKEAVGAMTVLVKKDGIWQPDKNSYRKFKIKSAPTRDDPRMIAEVLTRRLNHPEWPYPDLIIIDGGLTQYNAAKKVLSKLPITNYKLPKLISFAKPQQKIIGIANPSKELYQLVQQAIYQTHNFVIRYHRNVRSRAFFDIMK